MNEVSTQAVETTTALGTVEPTLRGSDYPAYVGLDVHKETIAVAVAPAGRGAAQSWGDIANKPKAVAKLVARLSAAFGGEVLAFCYEAGPCGYGLYRQLLALGRDGEVVAPSLIPRKPGERVKTERRDALKLARALRTPTSQRLRAAPRPRLAVDEESLE